MDEEEIVRLLTLDGREFERVIALPRWKNYPKPSDTDGNSGAVIRVSELLVEKANKILDEAYVLPRFRNDKKLRAMATILADFAIQAKEPVTQKKEEPDMLVKREPKPRPMIVHFINADGDNVYVTTYGLEAAAILRDELRKLKIPAEIYSTVEE